MCVLLLNVGCVFFLVLAPRAGSAATETDVGTNPSVSGSSVSLCVLVPYVMGWAACWRLVCDVILFTETLGDENMFFMNRKEG